jgi:hypothetical protein
MSQTELDTDENGNTLPKEVYDQFQALRNELAKALDNRDENAVIQTQAKIEEFAKAHNIHLSSPVTIEPDRPVPPIDPDTKPTEGIPKTGGNQDPNTWKVVPMKNPPTKFKIVDDIGTNIATDFTTQENAEYYIAYYKKHTVPTPEPTPTPTPTPTTGERDQFGILKIMPDGPGKRFETKFSLEFKTRHYSSGKPDEPTTECTNDAKQSIKNQEFTIAFQITKFKTQDDTASLKILGGRHSSSSPPTGTCYDCQLNVMGGTGNTLELERPHPKMHPAHKQAKPLFKLGESIVGKWIVMKTVTYTINGGKDRRVEMYLAFPIIDINKPQDIVFRKYWSVDDTGQLEAGHIIEPIGSLSTLRIDGVEANGMEVKYASVREITEG